MNQHAFLKKVSKPKVKSLTTSIASAHTDPQFYSAMAVLPNPDPILRRLGRADDFHNAVKYDSHVMAEVRGQYGGLLKNDWGLVPNPKGDTTRDIAAFELCSKIFSTAPAPGVSWSGLIWNSFCAVYKGFSVAEVVWQREGNFIVPCAINDKPNRRFRFGAENDLRILTKANQSNGLEADAFKFLVSRHMADTDNPYGVALYSACFWAYTFKTNGFRWFAKFMERYGQPSPVGKYPRNTSDTEIQQFLYQLLGMVEANAVAIPDDSSVELQEIKVGAHGPHPAFIDLCNAELSKALTSQTLTTEVTEAGSRSTAETHENKAADNGRADRDMVARTMQQLVDWIVELNFPGAMPPLWQWVFEQEASASKILAIESAVKIAPVRAEDVYAAYQLTPPAEGDSVIFLPAAVPAAPGDLNQGAAFAAACGHTHQFKQGNSDKLAALAEQGEAEAKPTIELMLGKVREFAASAESLDELDDALPSLLDDVDSSEFARALGDARTIAHAAGIDDTQQEIDAE